MARVVTERGYDAATVADIVAAARVSRRTFYEHFADKQDCFVQGCWHGVTLLYDAVDGAGRAHPDAPWRDAVRFGLDSLLRALAAHPDYTWIITIETGAVRPAQAARSAVVEQWVDLWASFAGTIAAEELVASQLPRGVYRGLVGGIEELVHKCLVEDGAAHLPRLLDDATTFAVAVLTAPSPGRARVRPRRK